MRRRLVALAALLAGALTGLAILRRTSPYRQRVDLYYEDGSTDTLVGDEAKPLLEIARSVLA
jgi:hypothetical protein